MKKTRGHQFSISLVELIIYSVVLIAIVIGTYVVIKNMFKTREARAVAEASKEYEEEQKNSSKEVTAEMENLSEEKVDDSSKEADKAEEINLDNVDVYSFIENGNKINYSVKYFEPGKRDKSLAKNADIFSTVENIDDPKGAYINTCNVKRFPAVNENDNELEFFVYSDPSSNEVVKISSRENRKDYYKIRDYYYDKGRVKYVDELNQTVILPVNPGSSEITSRYYINKDCLVEYVYCENNKATVYKLSELEDYSEGTVEQYDYLEKDIINRAYITYFACKNLTEEVTISGYVLDEFNQPLNEITVEFYKESDNSRVANTKTNGDGFYSFKVPVVDTVDYYVALTKESLVSMNIYGVRIPRGCGDINIDTAYMGYTDNTGIPYNIQVVVRDAADSGIPINDGQIKFRNGINNRNGEVIASGVLDSTGSIFIPLSSSVYTAEVTKGGYETAYLNVVVKQDHLSFIGYAVTDLTENNYTAVLSWESSPLDLDSRLVSQYGKNVVRSKIDSIGSIMAETLNINDAGSEEYKIYLSDYGSASTGDAMSYNMTNSGATVEVYSSNGLVQSFKVPAAHAGSVWNICTIRNGNVIPDDIMFYNLDKEAIWKTK